MKDVLLEELSKLKWHTDSTGILMASFQRSKELLHWQGIAGIASVIANLRGKPVQFIMVNIIPPGVTSGVHTDPMPFPVERWHYPLKTNPSAEIWTQETGWYHMPLEQWSRLDYTKEHNVRNFGLEERIHLVVDL